MLEQISNFELDTRLAALFRGWCAICRETGAFLIASAGRPKTGNRRKYILIVPNETIAERGGLFGDYTWGEKSRKFLRADSDEEAIILANEKLAYMLPQNIIECRECGGKFSSPKQIDEYICGECQDLYYCYRTEGLFV